MTGPVPGDGTGREGAVPEDFTRAVHDAYWGEQPPRSPVTTDREADEALAQRGPRKTWRVRPRRRIPLWVSLSYGDPYGTRRWGAVWYGRGTCNARTPWGALWRAWRFHRRPVVASLGRREP